MSYGARRLLVVAMTSVSLLLTVGAWSPGSADTADENFVAMVSQRFGPTTAVVGSGASSLWRSSEDTIALAGSVEDGAEVTVHNGTGEQVAKLAFAAPHGESLVAGSYVGAQRLPDRVGGHPGVQTIDDAYCPNETGRFTVLDISPDLSRLDLVYEINCTNDQHSLFGEIRIGEPDDGTGLLLAPGHVVWPPTFSGTEARKVPVTVVNAGSEPVTVRDAMIAGQSASSFTVTDNFCSVVPADDTCTVWVRYASSGAPVEAAQLVLQDSTPAGQHVVELTGRSVPGHTSWQMVSDPDDYIGAGRSYDFSPANAEISASGSEQEVQFDVQQVGATGSHFSAAFAGDQAHPLLPGTTLAATEYPFNNNGPGLAVSGDGRGDSTEGKFTVQQATYDADGNVTSFAVTFEQHLMHQAPALFGSIAWRAADPAAPVPHPSTFAPIKSLTGFPSQGSAVLAWSNPPSDYFSRTVVRRAQGLKPPSTVSRGSEEYSGRGTVVLARGLHPETSYSWTAFTYYGSGEQAPPVRVTLRGTRLAGHTTHPRPRRGRSTTFVARLFDVTLPSRRPLADREVDVYMRRQGHSWQWLGAKKTNSRGRVFSRAVVLETTYFKAVFGGADRHLGSTTNQTIVRPR